MQKVFYGSSFCTLLLASYFLFNLRKSSYLYFERHKREIVTMHLIFQFNEIYLVSPVRVKRYHLYLPPTITPNVSDNLIISILSIFKLLIEKLKESIHYFGSHMAKAKVIYNVTAPDLNYQKHHDFL